MSSFVDVHRLEFVVAPAQNFLARLLGRQDQPRSILQDITFSLNLGDWVTLYGAPGAGKTTLLKLLAGLLKPSSGKVLVNGQPAFQHKTAAAGYLNATAPKDSQLSATEYIEQNLKRLAQSNAPIILLDDIADQLGSARLREILIRYFENRTVVVATRSPATAEGLQLPVLLLHHGALACRGTCDEMGRRVAAPRTLNAWIEGIRYDIFREIKKHPGVADVRLEVDGRFRGQRLTITLKSSHYLPALYDLISRVSVVRLEEVPVKLEDILKKL